MSEKHHVIDARRCKACGLCVEKCPKNVLAIGTAINAQGYNYVVQENHENCVCCDICGIMCPDMAIGVVVTK